MSTRSHSQANASHEPSPALVADGLLQRKCACGSNLDFAATCHECSKLRLGTRRPPRNPSQPSSACSSAQSDAESARQDDAPQATAAESGFKHDFSRVRVQNQAAPASQPKLIIGQPGDRYEQEADRIAHEIISLPDARAQQPASIAQHNGTLPVAQRACVACASGEARKRSPEEEKIQAKEVDGESLLPAPGVADEIRALRGNGSPLPEQTRSFFEPRFGYDFSRVRVHSGERAADAARSINARAFTTGTDIVFGAGQYDPASRTGKELLAHELTHVVQQVPHIARDGGAGDPPCFSGHPEGGGENANVELLGTTYKYKIWGTWKTGDTTGGFRRRVVTKWIPWRFGSIPANTSSKMIEYAMARDFINVDSVAKAGCQYAIALEADLYTSLIKMSGEAQREAEARKKKAEDAKKAEEDAKAAEAAKAGGGPEGAEGEPPADEKKAPPPPEGAQPGGTGQPPADQKKTVPAPPPDQQKEADAVKGGIQTITSATAESKAKDKEPSAPLKKDWSALADAELAKNYLSLLEHFAGLTVTEKDKTAAADGLTAQELDEVTGADNYLLLLTSLYAQGYGEFQAAKGTDKPAFFKLEEVIFEQVVRGNPTATHNNLKIGRSDVFPNEKNILGIVERPSNWLFYDADGMPLPGISGVGFRDKGYIGAKQPEQWGLNIAKVKDIDEGLFILLNSLRQTFSDPARMATRGAEIYFNNIELVNRRVREGLSAVIWQKFEEMLPYFVGFIAGELVASFLMKVPNPAVAGVGLALKVLLKAAGYLMQIDLLASALSRLKEVAWHLSRVEVDDKGQIKEDTISKEHVEKAAVPLRDLVADIALIAATHALGKLLRAAQSGEAKCELGCKSPCDVTETGKGPTTPEAKPGEAPKVEGAGEVKPGEPPTVEGKPAVEPPKTETTPGATPGTTPEVKPGVTPEVKPEVKPPEPPKRTPIPGDADYKGPQPAKSWKLADEGMGAHMVERQNVPSRPGMAVYDKPGTPRFYPEGGPENAGQAHIRMHQATKGAGISGRGGNPGVPEADLLGKYRTAYADPLLEGIRGDLRTPDGSTVIAKGVTPLEAFNKLVEWGEAQKAASSGTPPATPPATPPPTPPATPTP